MIFCIELLVKKKKIVNLIGIIIFGIPLTYLLLVNGFDYFARSYNLNESSKESGGLPFIYILKFFIFFLGILLFSEIIRQILSFFKKMIEILSHEFFSILLFVLLALFLLAGYPVSLTLAGTAIIVGLMGYLADLFPLVLLNVLPNRIFGLVTNETLIAVPLFIFMGIMLEKSGIAISLLENMSKMWGKVREVWSTLY